MNEWIERYQCYLRRAKYYLVIDTFNETDVQKDFKEEHFEIWLGIVVGKWAHKNSKPHLSWS